MFRVWVLLLVMAMVCQSLPTEKTSYDIEFQNKFLPIAQCEAIYVHMCPTGLCTVQSTKLNQTAKRDDTWTPAQHFCDAACMLHDGCRTICSCADKRLGKSIPFPLPYGSSCSSPGGGNGVSLWEVRALSRGSEPTLSSKLEQKGLSAPMLHCREPYFMSLKWEYSWNDTQEEPIVFAVEIRDYGDLYWKPYSLTRDNITVIEGLLPRQKYRFRVFAVGPSGVTEIPTESQWISTLPPVSDFQSGLITLDPPVSLEQISLIKYTNESASVRIGWTPVNDNTCTYELMWYVNEAKDGKIPFPDSTIFNVAETPMEDEIEDLYLDHTYFISMNSRIDHYEVESSRTTQMAPLVIKDCLSAFNFNLTVCRPSAPTKLNLKVVRTGGNTTQVSISWTAVKGHPTGYNVSLYGSKMMFIGTRLVPGTDTSAIFQNVPQESDYHAKVRAYSPAGLGAVALKLEKVKFSEDTQTTDEVSVTSALSEATSTKNGSSDSSLEKGVGGSLAVLTGIIVILLHGVLKKCHRKMLKSSEESPKEEVELDQRESDLELHLTERIGEGAFGTVWSGLLSQTLEGPIEVAVKMLKDKPSSEELRHFENEMSILKRVKHHPNVIRFICCMTQPPEKKIIMEYCKYGDLRKFLCKAWRELTTDRNEKLDYSIDTTEMTLSSVELQAYQECSALSNITYGVMLGVDRNKLSTELISFARQIASGMEFLTESGILHRDLAARNVLIAGDRSIRISDFGLSREVLENSVYRKLGSERVAVKWIAPEAFKSRQYTTKSDVWSYGILLWEIVTLGSSPYHSVTDVLQYIQNGGRLLQPENCSKDLYDLMSGCWEVDPDKRPSFLELRENMENLELSGDECISLETSKIFGLSSLRTADREKPIEADLTN